MSSTTFRTPSHYARKIISRKPDPVRSLTERRDPPRDRSPHCLRQRCLAFRDAAVASPEYRNRDRRIVVSLASPILKINSAAVYVFTGPYVGKPHWGPPRCSSGVKQGGRATRCGGGGGTSNRRERGSRPPATSSSSFTITKRSSREKVGAPEPCSRTLSAASRDLACESDASRTTNEPEHTCPVSKHVHLSLDSLFSPFFSLVSGWSLRLDPRSPVAPATAT